MISVCRITGVRLQFSKGLSALSLVVKCEKFHCLVKDIKIVIRFHFLIKKLSVN